MKILESKVELKKNVIRKGAAIFILAGVLAISGCSGVPVPNQEGEGTIHGQELQPEMDEKDKNNRSGSIENYPDTSGEGEEQEYILPGTIWAIAGMSAEEQLQSYKEENTDNNYFKNIEVNDEDALVLTMTEKQKELYKDKVKLIINENIEEAEKKEDIWIEISENYDEAGMVLGEKAGSAGFQVAYVKLATQVGIYQILNGCDPEDWGFHLTMERDGKIILDVDVPDDRWVLTNEDFGE
ncbi:hypothetical protein [Clostridium sp. Marseille-P3244]|uniref:hypothetical protein n=1 Tax=Clostridium sp. Marseille-P3244 TaxID=1871020 RepID=UPI00135629A3|nr:hypothetical protein [Clostridium sp. Marseille-P3244]